MNRRLNAVSLIELMVGLVLVSLVILGLSNIEAFSRNIFFRTDKKIKVQNDVAYVLQHMSKYVGRGIGEPDIPAINLSVAGFNLNEAVRVWTDSNSNGALDIAAGCPTGNNDNRVAYALDAGNHTVLFFPDFECDATHAEVLARNVMHFNVTYSSDKRNTLGVTISGCGNYTGCGSSRDNPQVNLTTSIFLPSSTSE